jgi:hypothetical protein
VDSLWTELWIKLPTVAPQLAVRIPVLDSVLSAAHKLSPHMGNIRFPTEGAKLNNNDNSSIKKK